MAQRMISGLTATVTGMALGKDCWLRRLERLFRQGSVYAHDNYNIGKCGQRPHRTVRRARRMKEPARALQRPILPGSGHQSTSIPSDFNSERFTWPTRILRRHKLVKQCPEEGLQDSSAPRALAAYHPLVGEQSRSILPISLRNKHRESPLSFVVLMQARLVACERQRGNTPCHKGFGLGKPESRRKSDLNRDARRRRDSDHACRDLTVPDEPASKLITVSAFC